MSKYIYMFIFTFINFCKTIYLRYICDMELIVKEVCKRYNIGISELADRLKISRQALNVSLKNNPTAERITEIANAINCDVHELIGVNSDFYHIYDDLTGEWLGIRKK